MNTPLDNYIGCLLGGAVGDALGAPTEFLKLPTIMSRFGPNGVVDYVEFEDGKGEITDDTQMLLFTAEGLLRSSNRAATRGIDGAYPTICFQSYQRWLHTQSDWHSEHTKGSRLLNGWLINEKALYKRRAPGQTCLSALRSGTPGSVHHPINNSKGCGGVMRIAPVGLVFQNPEIAFTVGTELAALTHGHPSGYLSSGVMASIISLINTDHSLMEAITRSLSILKSQKYFEETETAVKRALELHQQGKPSFHKIASLGEGWIAEEALSIALYCALSHPDDFEKAIVMAINHNGDTDSTGAITGNIVGLMLGEMGIPMRWLINLKDIGIVRQVAQDLYTEKHRKPDDANFEWNDRYPPC
ncbi:MAG TPA: ADP-ribosylglycohydrolase family protein [Flavobacterium sp.]|jgi:ADP-ribosylglycohydrolase